MVTRAHRNLLVAAAGSMLLLVAMGGIVCSTNSSGGCPDWPACHGSVVPPLQMNSILEYTHRLTALVTTALVLAAAVLGWRRPESGAALRLLPTLTIALIIAVAIFGAFAVLTGLPPLLAAIDLGSALLALGVVTTAAVVGWQRHSPARPGAAATPLPALSIATLASFFAVIVSGIFVAQGSVMRCVGGPLHIGTWSSLTSGSWTYTPRHLLGLVAALFAISLVVVALRNANADRATRGWAIAFGALCVAEWILNTMMVPAGASAALLIPSVVAANSAWSTLVVIAVRARMLAGEPVTMTMATA